MLFLQSESIETVFRSSSTHDSHQTGQNCQIIENVSHWHTKVLISSTLESHQQPLPPSSSDTGVNELVLEIDFMIEVSTCFMEIRSLSIFH